MKHLQWHFFNNFQLSIFVSSVIYMFKNFFIIYNNLTIFNLFFPVRIFQEETAWQQSRTSTTQWVSLKRKRNLWISNKSKWQKFYFKFIFFFEPESFNRNKLVYRIPVKASKQTSERVYIISEQFIQIIIST